MRRFFVTLENSAITLTRRFTRTTLTLNVEDLGCILRDALAQGVTVAVLQNLREAPAPVVLLLQDGREVRL